MINQELSGVFLQMAEILEFFDEPGDTFRIRAYRTAAQTVIDTPEDLGKMARERRLREIPGIGEGIAKKIIEYIETGGIKEFEHIKKLVPKGFFELLQIPTLGPKKLKMLNRKLGIASKNELIAAIKKGSVQKLPGFGARSAEKILEGISMQSLQRGRRLIGEVYFIVEEVMDALQKCPEIQRVEPAGSFRRCEVTIGDIDILATGTHGKKIMDYFVTQKFVSTVLARGETKASILTKEGFQVDLRVVAPDEFGSALQYFTGSKLHNVHLRTIAKNLGFKLSEYGFFKGRKRIASKTEEACYASLGMDYIPPELRTDSGEIETAFKHQIPKHLIKIEHIRGDLHTHSNWSDGNYSIQEMAQAAVKKGYEYIAITDHSPSLVVANGLTLDRLKKKKREIEELQNKFPIEILFGTEVDILSDGSIDYPNEVLKLFDIVVASIHSRFGQDNTQRLIKAMENPYVHIIGHPSGRRLNKRSPYPLQYDKLFKKATETGTILEINAQYERLDLQDIYMREAVAAGCFFAINSDAHSKKSLNLMDIGVHWARRGWVEKKHVINTFPLSKMRTILE